MIYAFNFKSWIIAIGWEFEFCCIISLISHIHYKKICETPIDFLDGNNLLEYFDGILTQFSNIFFLKKLYLEFIENPSGISHHIMVGGVPTILSTDSPRKLARINSWWNIFVEDRWKYRRKSFFVGVYRQIFISVGINKLHLDGISLSSGLS